MKPRILLLVVLAIVAGTEILVAVAFGAFGLSGGIGAMAACAAVSAVATAVPLYLVAVRPAGRHQRERRELSRKSELQDILIEIDAMALEATECDLMLRKAAEDLRRLLQAPRCTFWLFGTPRTVVEHRAMGLPPAATDFPLRESREFREAVFLSEQCTRVDDVRKASAYRAMADEIERFGARSFIEAPLRLPEGPIGFLFLARPEPCAWSEDSVAAAEAVAAHVAAALGHARDLRDRDETSNSLLSLMDHVPGLVYRGQRDWTMTIVSAEVERMTGYPPGDFMSGAVVWKDLIHPDDILFVKMAFRNAVARAQKTMRVEYRARHRSGSYRWFADRRRIVYDEKGHFLYADGVCLDITERKLAESAKTAPMTAPMTAAEAGAGA